jgi:type I restriction enzyme M protein
MESCLLVCRKKKPAERKGKILLINAIDELKVDRTNAWLEPKHIEKIANVYKRFENVDGFAKVVTNDEVLANNGNLNLQMYVNQTQQNAQHNLEELTVSIKNQQTQISSSLELLFKKMNEIGIEA